MNKSSKRSRLQVTIMVVVTTLLVAFSQSAFADEDKIPSITQHSLPAFKANQGDKISLEIQAKGEGLLYRWIRNYQTLCREKVCHFDTSAWAVGNQTVVAVVFNKFGSQNVTFTIKVLPSEDSVRPQSLRPKLVAPEKVESVRGKDAYIVAREGIGYTYVNRDVKVIGEVERPIQWSENIKSHVEGLLRFGQKESDEHFLLKGSNVTLSRKARRRVIALEAGILRSRQLSQAKEDWTIMIAEQLQIDADLEGDLIVERINPPEKSAENELTRVRVISLRGYVRLLAQSPNGNGRIDNLILEPGSQVLLTLPANLSSAKITKPTHQFAYDVFKISTPAYLGGKYLQSDQKTTSWLKNRDPNNAAPFTETSKATISDFIIAKDYMSAIEELIYSKEPGTGDLQYHYDLLLGQAFHGIGLYKKAHGSYKAAGKRMPENPDPAFGIALLYLDQRQFKKAETFLNEAARLHYSDTQKLDYYFGVIDFEKRAFVSARDHFRRATQTGSSVPIRRSAEAFLRKLRDERWYGFYAGIFYGYDSNIFGLSLDGDRVEKYTPKASSFVLGKFQGRATPYEERDGELKFYFDIARKQFLASNTSDMVRIDQQLGVVWRLSFGSDEEKPPSFSLTLNPFIDLVMLGDERTLDTLGVDATFGFDRATWSPEILVGTRSFTDPMPGRDDLIDPTFDEAVSPSDRSGSSSIYGVRGTIFDDLSQRSRVRLLYESTSFKNAIVQVDNHTSYKLGADHRRALFADWAANMDVEIMQRSFGSSTDGRKDTRLGGKGHVIYYFTPAFQTELGIDYFQQSSSRSSSRYSRYQYQLGLGLEF